MTSKLKFINLESGILVKIQITYYKLNSQSKLYIQLIIFIYLFYLVIVIYNIYLTINFEYLNQYNLSIN